MPSFLYLECCWMNGNPVLVAGAIVGLAAALKSSVVHAIGTV